MATPLKPSLTVADLELMPDDGNRYELLEGELVVSRAPRLTHQRISGNIFALLHQHLSRHPIGEVFATPGIVFDQISSVIPDLVFVSYERQAEIVVDDRFIAAPELVIEILSPGEENAYRDRVTKRQIYGRFGVSEYWIVDPERQALEVYAIEENVLELQQTITGNDELTSLVLPDFVCQSDAIFNAQT
ncbi:MAG TPA: Uma2 family endonuclease [Herpetosiphonaceae bacterium]